MRNKLSQLVSLCAFFSLIIGLFSFAHVSAAPQWYWYYSSDFVSEYYDPQSLRVVNDDQGLHIEVWTKTTYSPEGVQDTVNQYGLANVSGIQTMKYSLGRLFVRPADRKIAWQFEGFYDANGRALWSRERDKDALVWLDVRPNSSQERYFFYMLDQAVHPGENRYFNAWKDNKDRWVYLFGKVNETGGARHYWLDSLSILDKGELVDAWVNVSTYNDSGVLTRSGYRRYLIDRSRRMILLSNSYIWDKDSGKVGHEDDVGDGWQPIISGTLNEGLFTNILDYVSAHRLQIQEYMTMGAQEVSGSTPAVGAKKNEGRS